MVQSHMPKSVPSCLIILSNQPILHYAKRLIYEIFILSVYHYFKIKIVLLGESTETVPVVSVLILLCSLGRAEHLTANG